MVRAFMTHGHLKADLDPLQLDNAYAEMDLGGTYGHPNAEMQKLIDYTYYGFTEADLDRSFYIDVPELGGILSKKKEWTLRELNDALKNAYSGKIGVEFMHIPSREECTWIRNKFELKQYSPITDERKSLILDRILWTDEFSGFIAGKFNTMKRFGLEGCESFIPGMKAILDKLNEMGGEKVVIGMPHRGRLNMLANVVRKPTEIIFAEFQGVTPTEDKEANWHENSGDVKYHLGTSFTREYPDGSKMTCEILANPSHLECINPVVMGKVRAEQHFGADSRSRGKICPVLIHGDAAFSGQGVVYESMQM